MLPLTDTHCHLDFNAFDHDRDGVLYRARKEGVVRLLNPGIDLVSSLAAINLANVHPEIFAAVGIHPNSSDSWDDLTADSLRKLAAHKKVVAIGEIGLDYYRDRAPVDLQKEVFAEQLTLAAELQLPVIIHNRQATGDVLEILAEWVLDLVESGSDLAKNPGVLHSFSGPLEPANKALELNFLIGITGPVTFKNAEKLQDVVAKLPLEGLLIETDAPFLAPHPKRGRRNEPENVRLVAEKISELLELPVAEVIKKTAENARQLFHW